MCSFRDNWVINGFSVHSPVCIVLYVKANKLRQPIEKDVLYATSSLLKVNPHVSPTNLINIYELFRNRKYFGLLHLASLMHLYLSGPLYPQPSLWLEYLTKRSSLLSHCCSMHMENESLMQATVVRGSVCTVCSRNGTFVWEFTIAQCQATGKGSRLSHETKNHRYHFRFLRSDPLSSIVKDSRVLFLVIFFLELVFLVLNKLS